MFIYIISRWFDWTLPIQFRLSITFDNKNNTLLLNVIKHANLIVASTIWEFIWTAHINLLITYNLRYFCIETQNLCGDIKLAVPTDAQAAVAFGGVTYGHNPNMVIRIAKSTYGVSTFSPFKPGMHPDRKMKAFGTRQMCMDLFMPFCHKGEVLPDGTHGQMVASPVVAHATHIAVYFYSLDRMVMPDEVNVNWGQIMYMRITLCPDGQHTISDHIFSIMCKPI